VRCLTAAAAAAFAAAVTLRALTNDLVAQLLRPLDLVRRPNERDLVVGRVHLPCARRSSQKVELPHDG
jgi:hypothetical protein